MNTSLAKVFLERMSPTFGEEPFRETAMKKPFVDFNSVYFGYDNSRGSVRPYENFDLKEAPKTYEKPLINGTIGMYNLLPTDSKKIPRGKRYFYIYLDGPEVTNCQTLPFINYEKRRLKNAFGKVTEGLESLQKYSTDLLEIKKAEILVIN